MVSPLIRVCVLLHQLFQLYEILLVFIKSLIIAARSLIHKTSKRKEKVMPEFYNFISKKRMISDLRFTRLVQEIISTRQKMLT